MSETRSAPRPLVSPHIAEAETARELGARRGDAVSIKTSNPDQRSTVRWWLRCEGVPGNVVKMLTTSELLSAWNSITALSALQARAETSETETPETAPKDASAVMLNLIHKTDTPRAPQAPAKAPAASQSVMDAAAAFAAALAAQEAKAPPLDEDAIRALVAEELARSDRPQSLRVTIGAATHTLPAGTRHPRLPMLLTLCANASQPGALVPYLVGPAGSGKTTAAEQVAKAMGRPFFTLGALTGAHELMGYKDASGTYHATPFRQAFEHGGVFLLDEADRSDAGALIALNSALANGFAGFPDRVDPIRRHPDFCPVIAANTYGSGSDRQYVGANQLDAASIDRFAMLDWPYDETLETALAGLPEWSAFVQAVRAVVTAQKVRHIVSPRASMAGATYLRAGIAFSDVCDLVIWKGLADDVRRRILDAVPGDVTRTARAYKAPVAVAQVAA